MIGGEVFQACIADSDEATHQMCMHMLFCGTLVSAFALRASECCGYVHMDASGAEHGCLAVPWRWHIPERDQIGDTDELLVFREHGRGMHLFGFARACPC